jgi:hypothetical protein
MKNKPKQRRFLPPQYIFVWPSGRFAPPGPGHEIRRTRRYFFKTRSGRFSKCAQTKYFYTRVVIERDIVPPGTDRWTMWRIHAEFIPSLTIAMMNLWHKEGPEAVRRKFPGAEIRIWERDFPSIPKPLIYEQYEYNAKFETQWMLTMLILKLQFRGIAPTLGPWRSFLPALDD